VVKDLTERSNGRCVALRVGGQCIERHRFPSRQVPGTPVVEGEVTVTNQSAHAASDATRGACGFTGVNRPAAA
jgi:hypothetical protein